MRCFPRGAPMRRREFITLFGGALAAWPIGARAQQRRATPRVGVLWHAADAKEEEVYLGALTKAFHDLGYRTGRATVAARYRAEHALQIFEPRFRTARPCDRGDPKAPRSHAVTRFAFRWDDALSFPATSRPTQSRRPRALSALQPTSPASSRNWRPTRSEAYFPAAAAAR